MVVPLSETKFLDGVEIGLGAWSWGDRVVWNYGHSHNDEDIKSAFDVTLESGINFIDSAEIYGQGRSERILGQLIKTTEKPVYVATKFFPLPWRIFPSSLESALRASLERLDLEKVDLYQIHWPFPPRSIEFWAEQLAKVQQLGLTRLVGVSNYDKNQMQRAFTVLAKHNVHLASNQVEYNLLNRKIEKNGLLARCQELGIRVIAYSPLAMGLLSGKYSVETPPPGMRARKYSKILLGIKPLIKLMTEIGQDLGGKTPAQIALNWTICKGTLPIPGAKNAHQSENNAGSIGWSLNDEQIKALDEASDNLTPKE
jgi:aryl-alcohol dehydrogenase-like predicted oxidoreductase